MMGEGRVATTWETVPKGHSLRKVEAIGVSELQAATYSLELRERFLNSESWLAYCQKPSPSWTPPSIISFDFSMNLDWPYSDTVPFIFSLAHKVYQGSGHRLCWGSSATRSASKQPQWEINRVYYFHSKGQTTCVKPECLDSWLTPT